MTQPPILLPILLPILQLQYNPHTIIPKRMQRPPQHTSGEPTSPFPHFLQLHGKAEQHRHRDAKHGWFFILSLSDNYTVRVWCGTHAPAEDVLAQMDSGVDYNDAEGELLTLRKGQLAVFDARLIHAGGPARMLTPLFNEKLGLQDAALHGFLKDPDAPARQKDATYPVYPGVPIQGLATLRANAPDRDGPDYNAWEADYCLKAREFIADGNPNDIDVVNAACDIIACETTNDMLGKSKYVRKFIGDLYNTCTNDAVRRRGLAVIVGDAEPAEANLNKLIHFFAVQLYEDKLYALVKRIAHNSGFALASNIDADNAKWAIRQCFKMIQVGYARLQVVNGRPADMFLKKLPKIPAESGFRPGLRRHPLHLAGRRLREQAHGPLLWRARALAVSAAQVRPVPPHARALGQNQHRQVRGGGNRRPGILCPGETAPGDEQHGGDLWPGARRREGADCHSGCRASQPRLWHANRCRAGKVSLGRQGDLAARYRLRTG